MNLYTYYVLYVCNEINLALLYVESLSEQDLKNCNSDYADIAERVISDLRKENLKIINEKLTLEKESSRFTHAHVIEDRNATDFNLYYIEDVDKFVEDISDKGNLTPIDEEYNNGYFITKNEKSKEAHNVVMESLFDSPYDEIKRVIVKDNSFEFFPFTFWMKVNQVKDEDIKTGVVRQEFVVEVNKPPIFD